MSKNTSVYSRPITACQVCDGDSLQPILFLGYIPPVNEMPDIDSLPVESPAFPLELLRCPACSLVQIGLEVDPEVLFPFTYPYLSGSTRILRENFADLYEESTTLLELDQEKLVVDIGSNDGTLLSNFHENGYPVLGIEPSQAGDVARTRGIRTETAYFGIDSARKFKAQYGAAGLITAANVFAHIGDIHSVVDGITELLTPEGVFVSESHYLLGLVETLQYDTIYHEHLRYYSLESISFLLRQHGLEVFHVKRIPTHGGSIRVYAARPGQYTTQASVADLLQVEKTAGISDGSALKTFKESVIGSKLGLMALLKDIKNQGGRIYGIGAPSRASTLINYTGLDDGILDAVMEISTSHKIGKYVPGTRIPVLDEALLFEEQPEYALLLSWHIADELMAILKKKGFSGKFIRPLPKPEIVA